MATVRIYRVAELLGTTSQEVMALLKRDHGIEVKSASSTIEEVVGRQFVDRLARQRGVTLPSGDIFAEGASAKAPGKKPVQGKKATTEPAKPAGPTLGPPRLVKAAKAIHEAERAAAAAAVESPDEVAVVESGPRIRGDAGIRGLARARFRRLGGRAADRGRRPVGRRAGRGRRRESVRRSIGGNSGRIHGAGGHRASRATRRTPRAADHPSPHRRGGSATPGSFARETVRAPAAATPAARCRRAPGHRGPRIAQRHPEWCPSGRHAAAASRTAGAPAVLSGAAAWRATPAAVAAGPSAAAWLRRTARHAAASWDVDTRQPAGRAARWIPSHLSAAGRSGGRPAPILAASDRSAASRPGHGAAATYHQVDHAR